MKKMILPLILMPLLVVSTGCDKINALIDLPETLKSMNLTMQGMSDTTKSMNRGMGTTNNGIHNQTMKLALDGLMDKNNWDELNPAPFKLMPYGKAFAEEATVDELMKFFQDVLKELQEAKVDMGLDPQNGNTIPYVMGSPQFMDVLQEKQVKLTILSIIAGFAPQDLDKDPNHPQKDIVGEIISHEIVGDGTYGSGEYRDEALAFLALRAKFVNDVLLQALDLAAKLTNVGKVEYAITDARKLDFIAKLPQATGIAAVITPKILVVDKVGAKPYSFPMDMTTAVDPGQAMINWKAIRTGIDLDLKVGQASAGVDAASAAANAASEQRRAQSVSQTVNQYLSTWVKPVSNKN